MWSLPYRGPIRQPKCHTILDAERTEPNVTKTVREFRGYHPYFGGAFFEPLEPGFRRGLDLLKTDSILAMKSEFRGQHT